MNKYYLMPTDGRASFGNKAVVEQRPNNEKWLYSYGKLVAMIRRGKVYLLPDWNYSDTTVRHVRSFLVREGFPAGSKAEIAKRYEQ